MNNDVKEKIKEQARLELARRDFFEYCKLTAGECRAKDFQFKRRKDYKSRRHRTCKA